MTFILEYTRMKNSYCPNVYKIQGYDRFWEARDACSIDSSCRFIADDYCDNQNFWTCSEDILPSIVGSCTWTLKKTGMTGNILSRSNA